MNVERRGKLKISFIFCWITTHNQQHTWLLTNVVVCWRHEHTMEWVEKWKSAVNTPKNYQHGSNKQQNRIEVNNFSREHRFNDFDKKSTYILHANFSDLTLHALSNESFIFIFVPCWIFLNKNIFCVCFDHFSFPGLVFAAEHKLGDIHFIITVIISPLRLCFGWMLKKKTLFYRFYSAEWNEIQHKRTCDFSEDWEWWKKIVYENFPFFYVVEEEKKAIKKLIEMNI